MHIHIHNTQHVIDPEWNPVTADLLAYAIKESMLEVFSRENLIWLGLDLDKITVQCYGTLQVWELAIPEKHDEGENEYWTWTFFLFTERDMKEGLGPRIIDILFADISGANPEDFDSFASRSHRQDLHVFPDAARRLAMVIPPSANGKRRQQNGR